MIQEIRTIWLFKGIQGSGKSTHAMDLIKHYPGKYKRVNNDLLRTMLDNDTFDMQNEKFILNLRDTITERAIIKGYDVIIDNVNLNNKHWQSMCNIAKRIGNVRVVEKYFECPIEEAIRRNALRPRPVPDGVIRNLYKDKIKGKQVEVRDEFFPAKNLHTITPMDSAKKSAIICDVDGTIAVNTGRSYYDLKKVLNDEPIEPICTLVRILKKYGYSIIIVSDRENICIEDTETWLKIHNIPYDAIFMRKAGDKRKDTVAKEEIYKEHIEPYYNVAYALDDRPVCVRLWRSMTFFYKHH